MSDIDNQHENSNSSDEDEQRAQFLLQQARNDQLFSIIRKNWTQEKIKTEIQKWLEDGADINATNTKGKTVLDIALQKQYEDLAEFISKRGGKNKFYLANERNYVQLRDCSNILQMVKPTTSNDVVDMINELDALLLAYGKQNLTADKIKKINGFLQSGLPTQTALASFKKLEIDIYHQDSTTKLFAIDIAWALGYYYTMLILLEADSQFPKNFVLKNLYEDNDIPDKLKEFVRERQNLHEWIQNNKREEIKKYVANHQLSNYFSADNKSALETAAGKADAETITCLAFLQFPFRETNLSEEQRKLLRRLDTEGNTLLSIAAENGKADNVDLFLRCGIDLNHQNKDKKRAIDLAWNNKRYDVVLKLLKADSDLPEKFNLVAVREGNNLKLLELFVEERNKLHKFIKEKPLEDIKGLDFNKSKFYLNSNGHSVLFTAISCKKYDIYAFLKSIGLIFKNEIEEKYLDGISYGEKYMLKIKMIQEFPTVDNGHILYLTSKTRSQKPIHNFEERVTQIYRTLDGIPEVSIILKVLQYADYLDIVVDFDKSHVKNINPLERETTRGITEFKDGRIFVAAAKGQDRQLLGTLAHELTHLAMYILYDNDCNPFNKGENEQSQRFSVITAELKQRLRNIIDNLYGNESTPLAILAMVFDYPEDEYPAELIVRVPHILAQFRQEGRNLLEKQFRSLIDYYNDDKKGGMLNRCMEFINNSFLIKQRIRMQILNETLGEINNIVNFDIHFQDFTEVDIFLNSTKRILIIETDSTFLSILKIYEHLIIKNKNYSTQETLFLEINAYTKKEEDILKLFFAVGKILCLSYSSEVVQVDEDKLIKVLKNLKKLLSYSSDKNILFILPQQHKALRIFHETFGCYQTIREKFTLHSFTKESQQKLSEQEIIFQGEKTQLNKIIDMSKDSETRIIDSEILIKLVKGETVEIGCRPPDMSYLEGAYSELFEEIDLKFLIQKQNTSTYVYIISGISGSDKIDNLDKQLKIPNIKNLGVAELKQENLVEILNEGIYYLADHKFEDKDFKQICHHNPTKTVYLINFNELYESKFVLQQIYNPDFYIKGKRFNNEVIIDKKIIKELCCDTLSEMYIFSVGHEEELEKWLQLKSEQKKIFEMNCKTKKIRFLYSQNELEDYFQACVRTYVDKTVHLLELKQGQLIWRNTYGSFEILSRYRVIDHKNNTALLGEDDVMKIILDKKVVIIAGDPGTGKSTAITHLYNMKRASQSNELKSKNLAQWSIKVDLRDNLDAIEKIRLNNYNNLDKVTNDITKFLMVVDKNFKCNLTKKIAESLIKIKLRKDYVGAPLILVFDGFDEILDDENRNKIIKLLQHLKNNTCSIICVTTRFHFVKSLESALATFAIILQPMDRALIHNFITKYFSNRYNYLINEDEFPNLSNYIDAFLTNMREVFTSNNDISEFIGTPLQLYLMLDGSAKCFQEWMKGGCCIKPDFSYLGDSIWDVYANFVDRKYDIYCKKTGFKEKKQQKQEKEKLHRYHRDLALSLINFKSSLKESFKEFQDIVLLAGIVKSDGANYNFIHTTFTEFFAAKEFLLWIIKWKTKGSELAKVHKKDYLFKNVLLKPGYRIVRAFLNSILLKDKNIDLPNIYLGNYRLSDIVNLAGKENNTGIVDFVLKKFRTVHENVMYYALKYASLKMFKYLIDKRGNINSPKKFCHTVMRYAALCGRIDAMRYLIEAVDITDINVNVLHAAAEYGRLNVVEYLIQNGANVHALDTDRRTALHLAIKHSDENECAVDIIRYLIQSGAKINAADINQETGLHYAVRRNLEVVKCLVESGADINAVDTNGKTVLQDAASIIGSFEIVKYLVERGADINAFDNKGKTVLQYAATVGLYTAGSIEVVKYLVEQGANISHTDNRGRSVLSYAVESNILDAVELFTEMNAVDNFCRSVLHFAAEFGNFYIIKTTLKKGVDINASDIEGRTVLHYAARYDPFKLMKCVVRNINRTNNCGHIECHNSAVAKHLEMFRYLVEEGADANAIDTYGRTVLHYAVEHIEICKHLVENGANVNAADNCGCTVLHAAASYNSVDVVMYLVDQGANIYAVDRNGRSVLDAASDCLDIVEYLRVRAKNR